MFLFYSTLRLFSPYDSWGDDDVNDDDVVNDDDDKVLFYVCWCVSLPGVVPVFDWLMLLVWV